MINIFKHLLPRARAWRITIDKTLRKFFEGLTGLISEPRAFFEGVWTDLDPAYTNELDQWENQFALPDTGLSDDDRRDRLDGAWKAFGGQSPRYIQDTLRGAGFDVYVHEWWWSTVLPVLEIPFENNLNVKHGVGPVNFSRGTTGTYIREGVQLTAAIDAPRFEDEGLLIEGPSENIVIGSENLNSIRWAASGDVTFTQDGTLSSDGITELWLISSSDFGTPSNNMGTLNMVVVDSGQNLAYSAEVKAGDDHMFDFVVVAQGGSITQWVGSRFDTNQGVWTLVGPGITNLAPKYLGGGKWRLSLLLALNNTGQTTVQARLSGGSVGPGSVYFSKVQVEDNKSFSSSYILTDTVPVAREADRVSIPVSGNLPGIATGDYTSSLVTSTIGENPIDNAFIYSIESGAYDASWWDTFAPNTLKKIWNGIQQALPPVGAVPQNDENKIVSVVAGSTARVYVNGVEVSEELNLSRNPLEPTTNIYFGNRSAYDRALNGHIRDFRIYSQALTAEQLQFPNPPRGKFDAPILRDPTTYLDDGTGALPFLMVDGGAEAQDGGSLAQDGSTLTPVGYPLVNKIVSILETVEGDGSTVMQDGDQDAQDGRVIITRTAKQYIIPPGPDAYHYFLYIGGEEFPAQANVINSRRDELEDLCLKICPTEQWLGMLVNYN